MSKSDKRTIIRLAYCGLWWILFLGGLMSETTMGRVITFFSTIIFIIVLVADGKLEQLEQQEKRHRAYMNRMMNESIQNAYEYKPKKIKYWDFYDD